MLHRLHPDILLILRLNYVDIYWGIVGISWRTMSFLINNNKNDHFSLLVGPVYLLQKVP